MAAQALYLKYRPQTFDQVVGQEPITRTLRNALRQERIRHAYLFSGPRGTGKTTTARLLAKAVNCLAPTDERPCNACALCVAINEGRLLDLIEIDAASNRGIDEIRDIREKVGFRPNEGRYKIYVLDEAHMLTEPAFNALLKTLEEPPPHVIFTLVTTDPHKIPATITSRCQRFDFRRIPLQAIIDRLAYLAGEEGLTVEPQALELIAHQSTGAMRDAISLLDQLTSYGDEITLAQVQMVLGTVASEAAGQLAARLVEGDVASGLDLINRAVADGADPRQFGREVVEYLRGLLLIREGAGTRLLQTTAEQAQQMESLADRISIERLTQAIRLFNEATVDLRRGFQSIPQLPLEMALVETLLDSTAQPAPNKTTGSAPTSQTILFQQSSQAGPEPKENHGDQDQTAVPGKRAGEGEPEKDPPHRVAEQPAPAPAPKPAPVGTAPAVATGALSLVQVTRAWEEILQAVRRRNPTAEGALRSGCQPVEVRGEEIVVTFPYPFLRDKLADPQRRMEIQEALSEVVGGKCRIKLVLATEYEPQKAANPQPVAPSPAQGSAGEPEMDDKDIAQIEEWAQKVGGQVIEEESH
jgi:DNA polymerase-3 subunit gamma/tau